MRKTYYAFWLWYWMRAHQRNARASPACDFPRYVRSQHRFPKESNYDKKRNPRKSDFLLTCWVGSGAEVRTSCRTWKCCQTHIFLQNFVLVQLRTSPPKNCKCLQNSHSHFNSIPSSVYENKWRIRGCRLIRPIRATTWNRIWVATGRWRLDPSRLLKLWKIHDFRNLRWFVLGGIEADLCK